MVVVHLRRWVIWWFALGVLGGAIAIPNIILHNLTHFQESVLLSFGMIHWLLGGIICWAWDGVRVRRQRAANMSPRAVTAADEPDEDVLAELIGHHNRRMSPRHTSLREDLLTLYFLRHHSS